MVKGTSGSPELSIFRQAVAATEESNSRVFSTRGRRSLAGATQIDAADGEFCRTPYSMMMRMCFAMFVPYGVFDDFFIIISNTLIERTLLLCLALRVL